MNSYLINRYLIYFNRNGFIIPDWWGHTSELSSAVMLMNIMSSTEIGYMKNGKYSREEL